MDNKHYFITQKTARYFTHNKLSDQTKTIIVLLHGYAQTAENVIDIFKQLNENYFVVAPEGLNRFYSRGFGGTPVASWMSSLERESEIKDYIQYLDGIYQHLQLDNYARAKIVVIGFSQGVATLSRWVQATANKIDACLLVAGNIANEMHQQLPAKLNALPKAFFIGSNDSLISSEQAEALKTVLGLQTPFKVFNGKHELNQECFNLIIEWLEKPLPA